MRSVELMCRIITRYITRQVDTLAHKMESINKPDAEFIETIFKQHHNHYFGDMSMAMNETPNARGVRDPYPWLDSWEGFPSDAFLTWEDIQRVRGGKSITVLEPQDYNNLVVLTPDHAMLQGDLFYRRRCSHIAVSGTGGDAWLKPTTSLANYFRRMIRQTSDATDCGVQQRG